MFVFCFTKTHVHKGHVDFLSSLFPTKIDSTFGLCELPDRSFPKIKIIAATIFKSLSPLLSIVLARTRKIFCMTKKTKTKLSMAFPKIHTQEVDVCSSVFPFARSVPKTVRKRIHVPELRQKTLIMRPIPRGTLNTISSFRSLHSTKTTRVASYAIPHSQKNTANPDMAIVLLLVLSM